MPKTVYPVFPNYVFEGTFPIPSRLRKSIRNELEVIASDGRTLETNFGSLTNKNIPLEEEIQKLTLLAGNQFTNDASKVFLDKGSQIQICNPYLISINPGHIYPVQFEPCRWYNACVWLQTTNKGSMLYFEDFSAKSFSDRHSTQDHTHNIEPEEFKYVFWPTNVPWGHGPNLSMLDTIVLHMTFIIQE